MTARLFAVVVISGFSIQAQAADHVVNSESDLRTAILSAADGDTITFNVDVTLTQDLPAVQTNVTFLGNNRFLDGASRFRGFFVVKFISDLNAPVSVTIQDLTLRNARARGGAARDGGGGGAGLGGALFVANRGTATLRNVQLESNSAIGGLGGADGIFGGGGGGGLGGFAGDNAGGGGGGVGSGASGGNGGVGEDGSPGIMVGLPSGGNGAGAGFGVGGINGGGGGGGGRSNGTAEAGGGGGGVQGFPGSIDGSGGRGGFGGGGGGAGDAGGDGGMGGYGGGGGASAIPGGGFTGRGGFGGGGAGGSDGGFGGGNGGSGAGFPGGGGGAAMGGAVFVQEGGSLILAGPLTINGSTLVAGAGGGSGPDAGSAGSAFGSAIFLQGGGLPLSSNPGVGETQTVTDDITDQSIGGDPRTRGLTKSGAGTLRLLGANTYGGTTALNGGTLIVDGSLITPVTVNSGGTLGGAGTISSTVTVNSGGTLSPGSSTAILTTGPVILNAGSTLTIEINGPTVGAQYDQVKVTGGVTLGNATLNVVLGFAPVAGETFTIVANDLSDAVVGTFAALPEGSILSTGAGRFRVSYIGGSGNDVTLSAIGPPTIAKAFGTPSIMVNASTALVFTLTNPNAGTALTGVGFTDTLPPGLAMATPNGLANACGGTVTAVAGSGAIALVNGSVAAGNSCTITANVTGMSGGLKDNTTSNITSTEGGTGGSAEAFLVVVAPPAVAPPTIAKRFQAASVALNGTTALTFTLTNPNPSAALSGVGFADTLPAGLVVATPNGQTGSCGGGTITAGAGSTSIGLVSATLAASASCNFSVNVTGIAAGTKNNATSTVTSVEGGSGGSAFASLVVANGGPPLSPTIPIPTTRIWALWVLGLLILVAAGNTVHRRRRS